jgi:hypothetical protein
MERILESIDGSRSSRAHTGEAFIECGQPTEQKSTSASATFNLNGARENLIGNAIVMSLRVPYATTASAENDRDKSTRNSVGRL